MDPLALVHETIYLMDHRGHLRGAVRVGVNTLGMLDVGGVVVHWESGASYRLTSIRRAGAEIHFEGRRLAA